MPDVQLGEGRSNLADVLLARMATSSPANGQLSGGAPVAPDLFIDLTPPTNGAHK